MDLDFRWDQLPAQETCYEDDKTETLLFSGGLGSGKTYYLCRKAIKLSILNRGFAGGFLVPTFPDFKKDVEPTFEDIFESLGLKENVHYWYHKTEKTYRFVWNSKPLYIFTAEKPIAGPNLAYCLINEYSLIQFDRIKEMLRRVRVKKAPVRQKCLAGTPEDVHGWLEDFVEIQEELQKSNPNAFNLVYADTNQNTHLDDSYRKHLEVMLDGQALKVFASGQMVKLHGDYFYYSFDRSKNVDASIEYNQNQTLYANMDFNVGKMATSFAHIAKDEYHFFDEIFLKGNSDTNDMCLAIVNRYGHDGEYKDKEAWIDSFGLDMRQKKLAHIVVTCDASGKNRSTNGLSDVEILESWGFHVRFTKVNPRLRDRQILMNGLLYNSKIKINPKCKVLIKDFNKVQQHQTNFEKIKDKDFNLTHMSDGADYFLDYEINMNIRRTRTIQL